MLQVTDDLIRNVVQEVLVHMKGGSPAAPAKTQKELIVRQSTPHRGYPL